MPYAFHWKLPATTAWQRAMQNADLTPYPELIERYKLENGLHK